MLDFIANYKNIDLYNILGEKVMKNSIKKIILAMLLSTMMFITGTGTQTLFADNYSDTIELDKNAERT